MMTWDETEAKKAKYATLHLFNTMTRKKEEFRAVKSVKFYFCGPTVYSYAHIGNLRAYIFSDILRRYLEYRGYKVILLMNITDVDDKTIRVSRKKGISLKKFTETYIKAFFRDMELLKIEKADIHPKATEHINDIVDIVKKLMKLGIAYRSSDGSIYYDISKFDGYGKLAKINARNLRAGARVKQDDYKKDEARDFALWKKYTKSDGNVFWETEIGKGRPGWHIEDSAFIVKYFNGTMDIHGGGVDLIFPHHENEIAQTEPVTKEELSRYWVHCEHLLVDGKKMSKSLGNILNLQDIIKKKYDPLAFRYLCLSTHYRTQLNFTFESLKNASQTLDSINDFFYRVEDFITMTKAKTNTELRELAENVKTDFDSMMNDDLNIPEALSVMFNMLHFVNREMDSNRADKISLKMIRDFMMKIDTVFGFLRKRKPLTSIEKNMLKKREDARKKKDYEKSDYLRARLARMGVILEDTPYGVRWKKRR